MKKMKTIKFPNTEEAYDIYDDEAVRSINGNKPDENGDVADVALKSDIERLTEEIAEIKEGGGVVHLSASVVDGVIVVTADKTYEEIKIGTENGVAHVALLIENNMSFIYSQFSADERTCGFSRAYFSDGNICIEQVAIHKDNSVTIETYSCNVT